MSYKHFENKECEFYPCHKLNGQNCLFCFCPLYNTDCGGNYDMIMNSAEKPIKDCSNCILPHIDSGYDYVIQRLSAENGGAGVSGNEKTDEGNE